MITANIYNANGEPLTEGFLIASEDPADFEPTEMAAQEAAGNGTRCYIKWSRNRDGQSGFWGPTGACFEAHWYAKPGRPQEMAEGKRRNIYIDDESWERAQKLGNGNGSEGIRQALKQAEMIEEKGVAGIRRTRWQGDNAVDVAELLPDHNFHHKDGVLIIHQPGGEVRIPKGGWIAVDDAGHAHKDD